MLQLRQQLDPLALLGLLLYFVIELALSLLNITIAKFAGATSLGTSFIVSWVALCLIALVSLLLAVMLKRIVWISALIAGVVVLPLVVELTLPNSLVASSVIVCAHVVFLSTVRAVELVFSRMGYIQRSSDISYAAVGLIFGLLDFRTLSALDLDSVGVSTTSTFLFFGALTLAIYSITGVQQIALLLGEEFRENNRITELQNSYWYRNMIRNKSPPGSGHR